MEAQGARARGRNDLLRQLDDARGELGAAREKYSPEHPDVKNAGAHGGGARSGARQPRARAAAVRRRRRTIPPTSRCRRSSRRSATTSTRCEKIASLRAQADNYQRNVSMSPAGREGIPRAGARLRERAGAISGSARQADGSAARGESRDRSQGRALHADRAAASPEEPVSPNRLAVFVIGLILSARAGGGGRRVARGHRHQGARPARRRLLGSSAPLALIPLIMTAADVARGTKTAALRGRWRVASAVVALVTTHLFFRPLDTLWFIVMRRLGLTGVHRG